jgi:hypothetical protein
VRHAQVGLDEGIKPVNGARRGQRLHGALHQPEMNQADHVGVVVDEVEERTVPQADQCRPPRWQLLGSEVEILEQVEQLCDRFLLGLPHPHAGRYPGLWLDRTSPGG